MTSNAPPYDAIVLAGGGARRLGGADKPGVRVGGRALLDRVLGACADAGVTVVVAAPRPTSRAVAWTREDPPGGGPVAALDAGLLRTSADRVVVLSADLPFLAPGTVRGLLAGLGGAGGGVGDVAEGRVESQGAGVAGERGGRDVCRTPDETRDVGVAGGRGEGAVSGRGGRDVRLTPTEARSAGAAGGRGERGVRLTPVETRDVSAAEGRGVVDGAEMSAGETAEGLVGDAGPGRAEVQGGGVGPGRAEVRGRGVGPERVGDAVDGVLLVDADGRDQPLVAAYRVASLRRELDALRAEHGSLVGLPLRKLTAGLVLARVPDPVASFDCDTWDDIAAARARIREHEHVLDEWISAVKDELGIELDVDTTVLLDLARDAAHGVARPAAPLTTFLVGYAAGRTDGSAEAVAEAARKATALALRWAEESEGAEGRPTDSAPPKDGGPTDSGPAAG
ncbi:molybdopterin-guanine dinucleotide biosynthesis protein [Streptomyces acidiscabies]|nr:DUF6457 domain-containing protein [Streptomyces acidiscabies]GAQ53803.1 molybdopterin-guanine dinucleotide biosynthesis protein [Streptomyces acidiscabies]